MQNPHSDTLTGLAAQILEQAGGDRSRATQLMVDRLRDDPEVGQTIIDRALKIAAAQAIAHVLAYRRTRILTQSPHERSLVTQKASDRAVAFASARLAEFPLPSGKRLGDATRDDLQIAVTTFQRGIATLGRRANWLLLIAQKMPPLKTVGEVFSEQDLERTALEAFGQTPEVLSLPNDT